MVSMQQLDATDISFKNDDFIIIATIIIRFLMLILLNFCSYFI